MIDMPILVQWKWQERTKSFLVIFEFIDDFSKPNLRIKVYRGRDFTNARVTWAPSHIEVGMLGELLRYANIIDGLNEDVKRKLRERLEVTFIEDDSFHEYQQFWRRIDRMTEDVDEIAKENCIIDVGSEFEDWRFWAPVCPEYIDYVREMLKPYLR